MKSPSQDEIQACLILERELGRHYEFLDVGSDSRADWQSLAVCPGLVEVWRCTDQRLYAAQKAWARDASVVNDPRLERTWVVTTDGHPDYRRATPEVLAVVVELQELEVSEVDVQMMKMTGEFWTGPKTSIHRLDKCRVLHLRAFDGGYPPSMYFSPSGGGAAGTSDDSLREVESRIDAAPDLRRKLEEASEADQRGLFVWVDHATPFSVVHNVLDSLPSSEPRLRDWLGHLWVVHEGMRKGWSWSHDSGWRRVGG